MYHCDILITRLWSMLTLEMRCSTLTHMKSSRNGDVMRGGIGKKKYQRVGNVATLSNVWPYEKEIWFCQIWNDEKLVVVLGWSDHVRWQKVISTNEILEQSRHSFSGCWQCNANWRIQKRKCPMLRQHLHTVFSPCKKTLHWANVCFSEHGYFKTELAEF